RMWGAGGGGGAGRWGATFVDRDPPCGSGSVIRPGGSETADGGRRTADGSRAVRSATTGKER
ncbi:hypothetical protein, partial [Streptomyces europaeiscabiei]